MVSCRTGAEPTLKKNPVREGEQRPIGASAQACPASLSLKPFAASNARLPARQGSPFLGLRGLRARRFSTRRLAIARGDQLFLKLQPFVCRHGRLLVPRRQI